MKYIRPTAAHAWQAIEERPMLMLEKLEACPNGCPSRPTGTWNYDAQRCESCGYDALKTHDCMEATQEFRLQNDREWREKVAHLKGENAKLRAILDFQGEPVDGAIDAAYRQFSDRIDQLEAENERLRSFVACLGGGIVRTPLVAETLFAKSPWRTSDGEDAQ